MAITPATKPGTFVSALRHFFGIRPGTTLTDFSAELKALSASDRAELAQGLRDNGYPIPQEPTP